MGNCLGKINEQKVPLTVLVIGLDNSGKTTLCHTLKGDANPTIVPTVGVSAPIRRKCFGSDVVFYDLGGGSRIRGVWPEYYADVHGVVYVVDSTDPSRWVESADELLQALLHPMLVGKPVLVLANKVDLFGSASADAVSHGMRLDRLTLCRHITVSCSAKPVIIPGKKGRPPLVCLDDRIETGLQWLVELMLADKPKLDLRRIKHQAEQQVIIEQRRAATLKVAPSPDNKVFMCAVCSKNPAVRRCAAAGWEAVCEPCGTAAESARGKGVLVTMAPAPAPVSNVMKSDLVLGQNPLLDVARDKDDMAKATKVANVYGGPNTKKRVNGEYVVEGTSNNTDSTSKFLSNEDQNLDNVSNTANGSGSDGVRKSSGAVTPPSKSLNMIQHQPMMAVTSPVTPVIPLAMNQPIPTPIHISDTSSRSSDNPGSSMKHSSDNNGSSDGASMILPPPAIPVKSSKLSTVVLSEGSNSDFIPNAVSQVLNTLHNASHKNDGPISRNKDNNLILTDDEAVGGKPSLSSTSNAALSGSHLSDAPSSVSKATSGGNAEINGFTPFSSTEPMTSLSSPSRHLVEAGKDSSFSKSLYPDSASQGHHKSDLGMYADYEKSGSSTDSVSLILAESQFNNSGGKTNTHQHYGNAVAEVDPNPHESNGSNYNGNNNSSDTTTLSSELVIHASTDAEHLQHAQHIIMQLSPTSMNISSPASDSALVGTFNNNTHIPSLLNEGVRTYSDHPKRSDGVSSAQKYISSAEAESLPSSPSNRLDGSDLEFYHPNAVTATPSLAVVSVQYTPTEGNGSNGVLSMNEMKSNIVLRDDELSTISDTVTRVLDY